MTLAVDRGKLERGANGKGKAMAGIIAAAFIALPPAAILALLVVPMDLQKLYWFLGVPLAVLWLAGAL